MLLSILEIFIQVIIAAIFVRVILSWFDVGPGNFLTNFIYEITEPILAPFRSFTQIGMFDLSPLVAIILLEIVRELIRYFLG